MVDITQGTHNYPISFTKFVWPVIPGHYQGSWGIVMTYGLSSVESHWSNVGGAYTEPSVVLGF